MNQFAQLNELVFSTRTAYADMDNENKRLREMTTRLRKERDEYKSLLAVRYEMMSPPEQDVFEIAVMVDNQTQTDDVVLTIEKPTPVEVIEKVIEPVEPVEPSDTLVSDTESTESVVVKKEGDLISLLYFAMENATISESSKVANRRVWGKVAGEVRSWTDHSKIWEHINSRLEDPSLWDARGAEKESGNKKSSLKTVYGQVASCHKHLKGLIDFSPDLPEWRRFNSKWDELRSVVSATSDHKTLDSEQLKNILFIPCLGVCLTSELLQEEVDKRFLLKQVSGVTTEEERLKTMFLSFYAYHGLRSQDWNVMLKKDSIIYEQTEIEIAQDHTHGYVSLGNKTITLWSGKTSQTYPERIINLHDKVIEAIEDFHCKHIMTNKWTGNWLIQPNKDSCKHPELIVQRKFKRKDRGKWTGIFPELFQGWGGVGSSDMRKLWETHIRRNTDPYSDEIKQLSEGCGHSVATAEKLYLEFKNVYDLNDSLVQ